MATPIPTNRARFELDELLRATGGRAFEVPATASVESVSTDSRICAPGGLFVALRGETHDGHRFVAQSRERGALALVAAGSGVAGPRIEVADTLDALAAIARAHVDRSFAAQGPRPVLAIGGAAGKTTTRSLAVAGVRSLFGETLFTDGNLNNRIGVPMTLLTLGVSHRAVVVECGTSVRGEIAALGATVRPDVAVVLNVDLEHSERLGGLEEIADEEGALLSAARRVAVTSADEPLLVERLARSPAPLRLTFGRSETAHLRWLDRRVDSTGRVGLGFRLSGPLAGDAHDAGRAEVRVEVGTALLGASAALNVAAALAGALALLGRPASALELSTVADALGGVEAVPGRLRPRAAPGGALLLDDTYNSNPRSVAAALEAAGELAVRRRTEHPDARLVIALGDMLELGGFAARAHDEMVRAADRAGAAQLFLVGPEAGAAAARVGPRTATETFADSAAAAAAITGTLAPGDVLLVKGSRGTKMELLLEALGVPSD